MKIIVELPDNYENKDIINAVEKGIETSENATVGDMIMSLLTNAEYIGTIVIDKRMNVLLRGINYHWWHMPYRRIYS